MLRRTSTVMYGLAAPLHSYGGAPSTRRSTRRSVLERSHEWATAIRHALTGGAAPAPATGPDPFSLADPAAVQFILAAAGFVDVGITDAREPVYYGLDAAAAFDLVRDMRDVRDLLAHLDAAAAQRALARLRETLAAHETGGGVLFDSRAWIVTARCAAA